MKILIVDDEEVIRDGMVHVLPWESHQFDILKPASSGEEALERIKIEKPEIIITDIMMDGISGLELVSALREIDYPKEIIILSGYDEFDLVQEALRKDVSDYLLKTSTPDDILASANRARTRLLELMKSNENSHSQGNNRMIKKILLGNYEPNELIEFEKTLHCGKNDVFQLILIDDVLDEDAFASLEQASKAHIRANFFIHHEQTVGLVKRHFNLGDDYSFQVGLKQITAIFHHPLFVSDTFTQLEEMTKTYEWMRANTNFQYLEMGEQVITPTLIQSRQGISHREQFHESEQMCIDMLRNGTKYELKQWVDNWIKWLFHHPNGTPKSIEGYIQHLYFSVIRYIEQLYDLQAIPVKRIGPAKQLFQSPNHHVFGLFADLQMIIQTQDTGPKYVKEALIYIDKHLHEAITLQEVASNVHIHPNYLSEILRKEEGKTFLDIVTEKRMDKAGSLLRYSEKSVHEIANAVGYSDRKYFTQLFKRYHGLTPSVFRKKAGR